MLHKTLSIETSTTTNELFPGGSNLHPLKNSSTINTTIENFPSALHVLLKQVALLLSQVIELKDIIHTLENAGEIGLTLALHNVDGDTVKQNKPCCFVLEPLKDKSQEKKVWVLL